MLINIDIPIPPVGQNIVNVPIHYCGGHVVDAGGYGFEECKTGKWIREIRSEEDFIKGQYSYRCPFCGEYSGRRNYCPECGARMEGFVNVNEVDS